jgi:hypothetical protein
LLVSGSWSAKASRTWAGLKAGRWTLAAHVSAWLEEMHGISRSRKSIYYWLAKLGLSPAESLPASRGPATARRPTDSR